MTCVVGLVQNGVITLAADAVGTRGNEAYALRTPKIFRRGPFLIGMSGAPRLGQLMMTPLFRPPAKAARQDDFTYLVSRFVPSLQKLLEQNQGPTEEQDGELLIGFRSQLWVIDSQFQVVDRSEPYLAIGCGAQYALGALHILDGLADLTARIKLNRALQAAERFDPFVRGPYRMLSMKAAQA